MSGLPTDKRGLPVYCWSSIAGGVWDIAFGERRGVRETR